MGKLPLKLVLSCSKADVLQSLDSQDYRVIPLMVARMARSHLDAFSLFPNMEKCIR